jgi:hypothetical protein
MIHEKLKKVSIFQMIKTILELDQSTTMIYAAAVPDSANVIKGIECPIFVARVILFH